MTDFEASGALILQGTQLVGHTSDTLGGGTLSWTGWMDVSAARTVQDSETPGALDVGMESFANFEFSGYYIEIDGKFFGVFRDGPTFVVPYNATVPINDEEVFPDAPGSTNLFSGTLMNAANCFLTGTRIAVPGGTRAIETLRPGDIVLTAAGQRRAVTWVWRQTMRKGTWTSDDLAPVRIARDAFGPGRPDRDLTLSADHGIATHGVIVNAGLLINGDTITRVPLTRMPDSFVYWHIETDRHDVILANGLPSESFIDYVGRDVFDNYDAYRALHGDGPVIAEMSRPRVSSARLLPPALKSLIHGVEAA
jgi:hypothetical protein